jgi:hypothetical protein
MLTNPVLIIDLDNTILGNIHYLLLSHNMMVNFNGGKNMKSIKKLYVEETGVIRKGFIKFIQSIRYKFPDVKIHVYTASMKGWANKQIKWIEQNNNIQFDRPIFTRDDCEVVDGMVCKSVNKIKKRIKGNVDNMLIIDNYDVFMDYKQCFIKCSTYNYIYFIDLWKYISSDMMNNQEMLECIKKFALKNYMNPILPSAEGIESKLKYHKWFVKKYSSIYKNNHRHIHDIFWINMIKVLKTYPIYNICDLKKYLKT